MFPSSCQGVARLNGRLDICIRQLVSFDKVLVGKSGYSQLYEKLYLQGLFVLTQSIFREFYQSRHTFTLVR
jgi:hypothetical protein